MTTLKMLDLFAGSGVGVAAQRLGIKEYGVEIMPAAISTRKAAGMETIYEDVWDIEKADGLKFDILWASPPCQTFSVAGSGFGRKALDQVLRAIEDRTYEEASTLRQVAGESGDDRTALVLTPLMYASRFRPSFIALEQVQEALPVWNRMAKELQSCGYATDTGILDAATFGVPQTRRRAVLIAKLGSDQVSLPVGISDPVGMDSFKSDELGLISNYSSRGAKSISIPNNKLPRGYRGIEEPAFTATSKVTSQRWYPSMTAVTEKEAAIIQSYPENFPFQGTKSERRLQIGNAVPPLMAEAILKEFL